MGCLANFVSPRKLLESDELARCDIIEFNRLTYSHYGFYIGNGIVVNVCGPNSGVSSQSSRFKNHPKGLKMAQKLLDIAGYDHRYNKVRINNCVLIATSLGLDERSVGDAIAKATEGLKKDRNNQVILDESISYNYDLLNNNCEYFATRCKYKTATGFSIQVANASMHSTFGTVERVTSAVRHDLAEVVTDSDANPVVRVGAGLAYGAHTAVGWTAYGAKTSIDAAAGFATAGITSLSKLFRN